MAKYQEVYKLMITQNEAVFAEFKKLHDKYASEPKKWQKEFNEKGRDVQAIFRIYENRLCGHSENAGYGMYSSKLSEKFWGEIRAHFPKVDCIGLL